MHLLATDKTNLQNALMSEENFTVMKLKLDPDGDDNITVYVMSACQCCSCLAMFAELQCASLLLVLRAF